MVIRAEYHVHRLDVADQTPVRSGIRDVQRNYPLVWVSNNSLCDQRW